MEAGTTDDPSAPTRRSAGWRAGGWWHAILDVLVGPEDTARTETSLRWVSLVRLLGPGSIPLAGILLAITVQLLRTDYESQQPIVFVFVVAQALAIVVVRYRATIGWTLAAIGFVGIAELAAPIDRTATPMPWPWLVPGLLGYVVVQYAVGRYQRRWLVASTWLVMLLLGRAVATQLPDRQTTPLLALAAVLSAASGLIGAVMRSRHEVRVRLLEQEQTSAEERARREMLEERARIARELHDVVAHHMSVVAVQSSTAAYRLPGLSDEAKREFESVAAQARESLTEMRRLLGLLRSDESAAERAPQPGLAALTEVVDATRRTGTPVQFTTRDLPDELPPSIELTAHRVVQEALSNVVRHAPGAAAAVEIVGRPGELVITVVNGPPSTPPTGSPTGERDGAGHGHRGMRERVAAVRGEITIGPRTDGGFAVEAVIPLESAQAAKDRT